MVRFQEIRRSTMNCLKLTLGFLSILPLCHGYLCLDNKTEAAAEQVLQDPFLALRTKCTLGKMDFAASYLAASRCFEPCEELEFEYPLSIVDDLPASVRVINSSALFEYRNPIFELDFNEEAEWLEWEIASDPDFEQVISSLHEITEAKTQIALSDIASTFLNSNETYYFRAKTINGAWCESFAFRVLKPKAIERVLFKRILRDVYTLNWESEDDEYTEYYVFGSNDKDFIPDIYFDKNPTIISEGQILDFEPNSNLLFITNQRSITIDGTYAYYRIIAKIGESLSVPSKLIYIYDNHLHPVRTALYSPSPRLAVRKTLPIGFSKEIQDPLIKGFPYNPHVDLQLWNELEPYFLPDNHPSRERLDRLFAASRATRNINSFIDAGFSNAKERRPHKIVFGINKTIPEVILKVFLDSQPVHYEWENWLKRINGAEATRESIERQGFHFFEVPHKWIYPLPENPGPSHDRKRKNFVLVAENMDVYDHPENQKMYRNKITKKILDQLYLIIDDVGLSDSAFLRNIPFTRHGTIAFVDTEFHHIWPIKNYGRITKYMSEPMQKYWKKLIKEGGPRKKKTTVFVEEPAYEQSCEFSDEC